MIEDLAGEFGNDAEKMRVVFANSEKAEKLRNLSNDLEGKGGDLLANIDQLDVIEDLAGEFGNDAEKMGVVFANSEKAEKLRNLSNDLEGKGGDLLANIDQLDVIEELAINFENDAKKMGVVFENIQKIDQISSISKRYPNKSDEILSAVDNLTEVTSLVDRFESDQDKIEVLFDNVDRIDDIKTMADKFDLAREDGYAVGAEDVIENLEFLDDVLALDSKFEEEDAKLMNLYLNPQKAAELKVFIDKYGESADDLIFNLDALESISSLEDVYKDDLQKMSEVLENADKAIQLSALTNALEGKEGDLLANIDQLDVIEDLANDFENDAAKMSEVFANADKASKIIDLKEQLGGSADELLANVDQLDVIEDLANDFENDAAKMSEVFANADKASKIVI